MNLKDKVREQFEEAKRAGKREEKNVLSVILGDIATLEARTGKDVPDAEVEKLLRKMVESNVETVAQLKAHNRGDDPQMAVLERETAVLKALLPQTLDAEAIGKALEPVRAEILAAKNDGQAMGVAMKHLKTLGLKALSQDVTTAVQAMRAK